LAQTTRLGPGATPRAKIDPSGGPTLKTASDTTKIELGEETALFGTLVIEESISVGVSEGITMFGRISVDELMPINITENAPISVVITTGESIPIGITDESTLKTFISVSDAIEAGILEDNVIAVQLSVSDTVVVGLTELGDIFVTLVTLSDALGVGLSEITNISVTIDLSDNIKIVASEVSTLLGLISVSDSLRTELTESPLVFVRATSSDTVMIQTVDESVIFATLTNLSDSLKIGLEEISDIVQGLVPITSSDSIAVGLVEAGSIVGVLTVADSAGVGLEEAFKIFNKFSVSDSLPIGVVEAGSVFVTLSNVTDGISIGITDSSQTIDVVITGSDAVSVGLTEAMAITARLSVSDSIRTALLDELDDLLARLDASDSTAVIVTDVGTVVDLSGVIEVSVSDNLRIALEDESLILGLLALSDTLPVGLTEAGTRAVPGVSHGQVLVASVTLLAPIYTVAKSSWSMDYQDMILADSPIGYWRLGEPAGTVAVDEVNAINGTYAGGITLNQTGALIRNADKSIIVDGVDGSNVQIPIESTHQIGLGDKSWDLWFKTSDSSRQGFYFGGGNFNEDTILIQIGQDQLGPLPVDDPGIVGAYLVHPLGTKFVVQGTTRYDDGNWHHVAVTFDRDGLMILYVDGVNIDSTDVSALDGLNLDPGNKPTWIGGVGEAVATNGSIDEVAVYDTVLSADEVLKHYLVGLSGKTHCAGINIVEHPDWVDYNSMILSGNPVGYWRLGETSGTISNDEIGTADGMYSGGFTLGQSGAIVHEGGNKAVAFDGVDGQNSIPHVTAINFGTGDLSVEFWMKSSTITGAAVMMINKGGASGRFWIEQTSTGITINCYFGGALDFYLAYTVAVTDGEWHHIVATFDRDGLEKIYVDGVKGPDDKDISGGSAVSWDSTSALIISSGVVGRYNGSIDELALYDRILTPEQIMAHYKIGSQMRTAEKQIAVLA